MLVKWAAEKIAKGLMVGEEIFRCRYHDGWHIQIPDGENPHLMYPLPAFRRPQ